VALVRTRRAGRASNVRPALRMLELSAGLDDILVVVLAMLAFTLVRTRPEPIAPASLVALSLAGGALLGAVTWLFLGRRASEDERMLLGLAMLTFTAGFASWLELSPAVVAAISAVVVVNLPGDRMGSLLRAVSRVERPAAVILMTVMGFEIAGAFSWLTLSLLAAMTLLRLAAKVVGARLVAGPIPGAPGMSTTPLWGLGLAPLASLLGEIAGPWLLLRLIRSHTRPEASSG
jgi:hypothetical protein